MIRVVSFDVDDTLYDFTSASRRGLAFVAQRVRRVLGDRAAFVDTDFLVKELLATADAMEHAYARIDELRRRAFSKTLRRCGAENPELVEELGRIYVQYRSQNLFSFPGVREALEALAGSYTLCAISNGEQGLEMLGLSDLFSFIAQAGDVGVQKPDKRIFAAAMQRAGCAPGGLAHVGDSLSNDVAGAKAAGAWAVWFNPMGRDATSEVAPDAEVRNLLQLPAVLQRLDRMAESSPR